MINNLNIKILGAGPTGSLLAISLANMGCNVSLYDIKSRTELVQRTRAYALTHSSRKLLQKLNLWDMLKEGLHSFENLILNDSEFKGNVLFTTKDLNKDNRKYNSIGWIIEHSLLMDVILNKILNTKKINLFLGQTGNYDSDNQDLVIAADGINSKSRSFWGIRTKNFKYKQGCLTIKVLIRNSDPKSAFEILRPEGPFAILPLGGDKYQIVWSANLNDCIQTQKLSNTTILDRISTIVPYGYQPDAIIGPVNVFPNCFMISNTFAHNKFYLVGEAAHSFHPVGGQGLNLCWRDVDSLSNMIKYSENKKYLIKYIYLIYNLIRLPDVICVALSTDIMIRIYSNKYLIFVPIRKLIQVLLKYTRMIRRMVLGIMTDGIYSIITFRNTN